MREGDLFSWNEMGKLEVTTPEILTKAVEELMLEMEEAFTKLCYIELWNN